MEGSALLKSLMLSTCCLLRLLVGKGNGIWDAEMFESSLLFEKPIMLAAPMHCTKEKIL